MRLAGWYGILVGLLMLGQWGFFLATGQVPELRTAPIRIYFHLAGEFATAVGLLASGIALLKAPSWALNVYLVAAGSYSTRSSSARGTLLKRDSGR